MDFSKLKGTIYFNNKYLPSKKANIHVLNHSLHFATSVFEGIAVYNNKPFLSDDHFKRLIKSAKLMKLKFDKNVKELEIIAKTLIKKNKITNGYIRPIIFRSENSMSPDTKECTTKFAMATWEWGTLFKKKYISLDISRWPKLSFKEFPIAAKSSGSYQASVISREELNKKKFDDCIMLDLKGNIAESTACNIFWIKKKTIYTPKSHSILDGITRRAVIEIAKKKRIKVVKGDYKVKDILSSDGVFLTGTAAEIQQVSRIKNTYIGKDSIILKKIKIEFEDIIKKNFKNLKQISKS
tara:strand:- start:400 stop:1287 length:888 start_codon:yes stop_codon:yes gene_type:complete